MPGMAMSEISISLRFHRSNSFIAKGYLARASSTFKPDNFPRFIGARRGEPYILGVCNLSAIRMAVCLVCTVGANTICSIGGTSRLRCEPALLAAMHPFAVRLSPNPPIISMRFFLLSP